MKKFILACIAITMAGHVHAQYGQRTYYFDSLSNESFAKGIISYNLSGGLPTYAATGTAFPNVAPVFNRSRFVRIRQNGTPLNNRMYPITRNGFELPNTSNAITEFTGRYVMAGSIQASPIHFITGGSDVLFIRTSVSGVASNPIRYIDLGGGYDEALCTKNSKKNSNRLYTCGYTAINGIARAFLMKHDATGSIVAWARYFHLPCPSGALGDVKANYLVEDSASGRVCVVGTIQTTGGCRQSFLARFSAAGVLNWLYIYADVPGIGLDFNSIRPTDIPNEYIITGTVSNLAPTGDRILLFRVNTAGAGPVTVFSNMIFSNGPTPNYPVNNQYGYDVCMRIPPTTASNKEFYVTGMTTYTTGTTDGHIFKCDSNGVALSAQLYGSNDNDQLNAIDWINSLGTPGDGLATFGKFNKLMLAGTPPKDHSWYVKSYFNLVSGCNEIADVPISTPVAMIVSPFVPTILSVYTRDTASVGSINCLQKAICWNNTLGTGSNIRTTDEQETLAEETVDVYPNPLSTDILNISLNSPVSGTVWMEVVDLTGRLVMAYQEELMEGTNTFSKDLSGLATGNYILRVQTPTGIRHKQLIRH